MSDPISIKLGNLLEDHRRAVQTFSDLDQEVIITEKDMRYHLCKVSNTIVNMNKGCKYLALERCKNITIITSKLPIMGMKLTRTDNTQVDIVGTPPGCGSGSISIDHSIIGRLETEQECVVDISECVGITLNGDNISDKYHDSRWSV